MAILKTMARTLARRDNVRAAFIYTCGHKDEQREGYKAYEICGRCDVCRRLDLNRNKKIKLTGISVVQARKSARLHKVDPIIIYSCGHEQKINGKYEKFNYYHVVDTCVVCRLNRDKQGVLAWQGVVSMKTRE